MNLKIFSVYDSKASFFSQPFFDQMEASAIRNFSDWVNDPNPQNMLRKHPEDYSLFLLGEFENLTGVFVPCLLKSLITASAVRSISSDVNDNQMELIPK